MTSNIYYARQKIMKRGTITLVLLSTVLTIIFSISSTYHPFQSIRTVINSTAIAVQARSVLISLPSIAQVKLKMSETSKSGKVVSLNKKDLTLGRSSEMLKIPLNKVDEVFYDRKAPFYRSNGNPVIRGDQVDPVGEQEAWNIPIDDFVFQDINIGKVKVFLDDSSLDDRKIRGVMAVGNSSTYVVDRMSFDELNSVTLIVTPY